MGALAIVLGIALKGQNIAFMVGLAFAIAASANFPALLMSIFWRRFTTAGAVSSILVGRGLGARADLHLADDPGRRARSRGRAVPAHEPGARSRCRSRSASASSSRCCGPSRRRRRAVRRGRAAGCCSASRPGPSRPGPQRRPPGRADAIGWSPPDQGRAPTLEEANRWRRPRPGTTIETMLLEERRYPPPPEFAAQANAQAGHLRARLRGVLGDARAASA